MTKLIVTLRNFCARTKKTVHFVHMIRTVRGDFFPSLQQSRMNILRKHFLAVFRKLNKTVLLNTTVSYYENNIYFYKILHVSTFFMFMGSCIVDQCQ